MSPTSCQTAPPRTGEPRIVPGNAVLQARRQGAWPSPADLDLGLLSACWQSPIERRGATPRPRPASAFTLSTVRISAEPPSARGVGRIVEVHELDDAQVVERADHREQHRHHGEPGVARAEHAPE